MVTFFTFACILGWWTKEIKSTLIIMVIWSVGAECLQAYYPEIFDFDIKDMGWNVIGSVVGIAFSQLGGFISNTELFMSIGNSNEIRERQKLNGNNT
jgi:glycopeptide antibiotics resistance protein